MLRLYSPIMRRLQAVAFSVVLFGLAFGWEPRQNTAGAQSVPASKTSAADLTQPQSLQSKVLRIEFDRELHSRIVPLFAVDSKMPSLIPFSASETLVTTDHKFTDFTLSSSQQEQVSDIFGAGQRLMLTGTSGSLQKKVSVTIYNDFPSMAIFDVEYTNQGAAPLAVRGWANNQYLLRSLPTKTGHAFWSYQSGSYEKRPDWVRPLRAGFRQENYLGMNASDYGGGTPVIDVWRKDVGLSVGHIEPAPRLISLPVSMFDATHARVAVQSNREQTLAPGESFHTLHTFVSVHQGDYFRTLTEYRRLMMRQGFQMASAPDSAFGPIWCAWGYGRNVQLKQVYDTLPTAKKTRDFPG